MEHFESPCVQIADVLDEFLDSQDVPIAVELKGGRHDNGPIGRLSSPDDKNAKCVVLLLQTVFDEFV
jgi:hypothetical protein